MLLLQSAKITTVEQDVISHSEDLVTARTEMKDLKSTLQRLQIDLQSHLSMVCSITDNNTGNVLKKSSWNSLARLVVTIKTVA